MYNLNAGLCRRRICPLAGFAALAVALAITAGCENLPGDLDGDANENLNEGAETLEEIQAKSEILNLKSNFTVSGADVISLVYTVAGTPDQIEAFYVAVSDSTPGAAPIADPVVYAQDIDARGAEDAPATVPFSTADIPAGNYRLGLTVVVGDGSFDLTTLGLVLIEDPPDPVFREPTADLEVDQGTEVNITFDAQKVPETNVQWRLFYDRFDTRDSDNDGVVNGLDDCPGTPLAERESVDANGCSPTQDMADFDLDLIDNMLDDCPGTALDAEVDSAGCSEDQRGTQIDTGSGNVGRQTWRTDNVTSSVYRIGVSATDTGKSVAGTVADSKSNRVVTRFTDATVTINPPPAPLKPPTLVFTSPSSDVGTFLTEIVTTTFEASINEEGAVGSLSLFLDADTTPNSGNENFLLTDGNPTIMSWEISTEDLAEGTYSIGGTVSDSINDPVSAYAAGKLIVVKTATLTVTDPNISVRVQPDTWIKIAWTTNVPTTAGTVDVYYEQLDTHGEVIGGEVVIMEPSSTDTTETYFAASASGIYRITVRIKFTETSVADLEKTSPQLVRVSGLPAILWASDPAVGLGQFDAAVFEGVNFEDNAGISLAAAGDLNDDDKDDFIIGARYGKPFFINPSGVGPGEAYVIYGGESRLSGEYNLNSVGTKLLTGVSFSGIRVPEDSDDTDGLAAITRLPDLDGDGLSELMFGFPDTASRGHNAHSQQDGVVDPATLCTLEKANQFRRGGVVIVSSKNSLLTDPDGAENPVINLDEVGQLFTVNNVITHQAYADGIETLISGDIFSLDENGNCIGSCENPQPNGILDSLTALGGAIGFNTVLSDDFITAYVINGCSEILRPDCDGALCGVRTGCLPSSPLLSTFGGFTGFYSSNAVPAEPFGARIIGIGVDDEFGTSVALSNQLDEGPGDVIISSPQRSARGILCCQGNEGTESGPEVNGLGGSISQNAGVAYLFDLRNLWENDSLNRIPPRPHQYMVAQPSHCDSIGSRIPNIGADKPNQVAIRIAGLSNDRIKNIIGIEDFNEDGRNDFAIGAPEANDGLGRVYVAFRRERVIEEDYVLEKLALDPTDPERLAGVLIIADSLDAFGSSLATGVDFNGDGLGDLIVGSPDASTGCGEVIVIFADRNLVSLENGIMVDTLLVTRRAARITGNSHDGDGQFGFNIANAGDVNGDGVNDLLVAAPNATPRFDPFPDDAVDELTQPGLDLDFDGLQDDIATIYDLPNFDNAMTNAGLVYVIYGAKHGNNRLDLLGGNSTVSIEELGSSVLRGFIIAGGRAGDRLGGGDAGDVQLGGIAEKQGRGRSIGVASAGDVDGDGYDDILVGAILADPRRDAVTGIGLQNGGEAYLIYGGVFGGGVGP